jgi:hypothetical protein
MKKILYPAFTAVLIAMLVISPADAGGRVSLGTSLSSLLVDITAWGLRPSDYDFKITASGIASVACTNNGGTKAPGQNYPHVDGTDDQGVPSDQIDAKGKVSLSLEAIPELELNPNIGWEAGGCPNENWTGIVDFVYWQSLRLDILEYATNKTTTYLYTCVTTRTGPAGDPNSTFDDGTVTCKPK